MSGLWDDSLYAGSAEFYAVGRFPYPQRLATELERWFAADDYRRLLDLGCGPGSLTLLLAPSFVAVVAVDADPDMLRVGQARASDLGIENVQWVHSRAETLSDDVGRFDMVTLAQSFHWMDRPVVADKIRDLLTPDGVCVHVGATTHEGVAGAVGLPHPAPPREHINDLVRRYLGPHRRAGQRIIVQDELPNDEDRIFRAAGYHGPKRIEIPAGDVLIRTADEVVASVLSLSSAAPHLFGPRLPEFVSDLRGLLRATSPNGVFAEQQRDITLSVWRA